ncbi:MAG TPA: ABC transporter permease [Acidobacteriota bacterium]|nr:ABC transporter permease [Acidobacteriota bacterium]HNH81700.1 ABC transporter permease [Acidobacteriota bacterium]
MLSLASDFRLAGRTLLRNPGFAVVVVLTLAMGIGANTAIFSVVNALLLQPLPYRDAERLAVVWGYNPPQPEDRNVISPFVFRFYRDHMTSFEQLAAFSMPRATLTGGGAPEEVQLQLTTQNLFGMLGVAPQLGRAFTVEDTRPEAASVVVLSHELWQTRFGGDPNVIGRKVALNSQPTTVIGVMPPYTQFNLLPNSFKFRPAQLWQPVIYSDNFYQTQLGYLFIIGQLKAGTSLRTAQDELDAVTRQLSVQHPEANTRRQFRVVSLREELVGSIRPALYALFGAVGVVLLIACANVANLLLARAVRQKHEFALRCAVGASPWQVFRQSLIESLLLAGMSGGLGVLIARWAVDFLLVLSPKEIQWLNVIQLDQRVLGFTLILSLATGIGFGLFPALAVARTNLAGVLKQQSITIVSPHNFLRSTFLVAQVALTVVLLIIAGLMVQSFLRMRAVDPGFDSTNVLTARVQLPSSRYRNPAQRIEFFRQLIDRIKAIPNVVSVGGTNSLPFTGTRIETDFEIVERPAPSPGENWLAEVEIVSPTFFQAMGVPVIQGRTFSPQEAQIKSQAAIINQALARQYFGTENPIGKHLVFREADSVDTLEIVGVVADSCHRGLDCPIRPKCYWPHPQFTLNYMSLVIRTSDDPGPVVTAIRGELASLDADLALSEIQPLEVLLAQSIAKARFSMLLFSIFGGFALVVAAIGIYAVMSYTAAERTREIGLRLALGAQPLDIVKLIVGQGISLTCIGIGLGIAVALGLTRLLTTLLYSVSASDPLTFFGMGLLLVAVACLACTVPVRRAMKVNPVVALWSAAA